MALAFAAALPGDHLAVSDFISEEQPFLQDWRLTYGVPGLTDKAAAAAAPWRAAFVLLFSPVVPRTLAYFGWQLMHAALPLGAERVPFAMSGPDSLACFLEETSCAAAACFSDRGLASSLETYSHAFVHCPVVAPAWAWARAPPRCA